MSPITRTLCADATDAYPVAASTAAKTTVNLRIGRPPKLLLQLVPMSSNVRFPTEMNVTWLQQSQLIRREATTPRRHGSVVDERAGFGQALRLRRTET